MRGYGAPGDDVRRAHEGAGRCIETTQPLSRHEREEAEALLLVGGATRASGAGRRAVAEEADPWRTCFERDRDRVLHSSALRRLAGKTQVFVFPADHQRTRLTHALEVAQVAAAIARACRLNVALVEAIALGHDCGHGPGGHASEDAFSAYLRGGFDHAVWGADVTAAPLNLCEETLDGIRNHSWSRPAPATAEGRVVGTADRIAYCAHDLEDAVRAGIVDTAALPAQVVERCGAARSEQLRAFIDDVVETTCRSGVVGMSASMADALATLRQFNYERIYMREESRAQATAVVSMLRALVERYAGEPSLLAGGAGLAKGSDEALHAAVAYVGGMTDRFACAQASSLLGWPSDRMPKGLEHGMLLAWPTT